MLKPVTPINETTRLASLYRLNVLDTMPEERFDRLTRLAKRLFNVPVALVSLVDANRQWFKSCQGLDARETSRDISFCGHAILGDDIFVVPDALADERFADNPLVTNAPFIRFYAGYPLVLIDGSKVGTLCIIDSQPRQFTEEDKALLCDLALMTEKELNAVQLASTDELTLLSNRRGFEALAHHALSLCSRIKKPVTLLFFDLDGFKKINDDFGHPEGDYALTGFARLLMDAFRDSDVISRFGGDEFAVLLSGADSTLAQITLQRLESAVKGYNELQNRGYQLRYSVGMIQYNEEKHSGLEGLLLAADSLMYESKRRRISASA